MEIMEWVDDAKACLDAADHMLDDVKKYHDLAISDEIYIPYFKVTIKNFLENCRSPLDYAAQYTFDTYCKKEYSKKERKNFNIYFPVRQTQEQFDEFMNIYFRDLRLSKPDFFEIFSEAQAFQTSPWLQELNKLVSKNKHRQLTKHAIQRTAHIDRLDIGGITFTNNTFVSGGTDITVDGRAYNFGDPNPPEKINYIGAKVNYEYLFSDLSKPVLPTLKEIYNGTKNVIERVEELL